MSRVLQLAAPSDYTSGRHRAYACNPCACAVSCHFKRHGYYNHDEWREGQEGQKEKPVKPSSPVARIPTSMHALCKNTAIHGRDGPAPCSLLYILYHYHRPPLLAGLNSSQPSLMPLLIFYGVCYMFAFRFHCIIILCFSSTHAAILVLYMLLSFPPAVALDVPVVFAGWYFFGLLSHVRCSSSSPYMLGWWYLRIGSPSVFEV